MDGSLFSTIAALLSVIFGSEPDWVAGSDGARLTRSRIEANLSLASLARKCPDRNHPNQPFFPTLTYRDHDMYVDCRDALDLLVKTDEPVDERLLVMAETGRKLPERYRAAWVLIRRRNERVAPCLRQMSVAAEAEERYLAWRAYDEGVGDRQIAPPKDFRWAIEQYEKETDDEVREWISFFLGTCKAKQALPTLVARLEKRPDDIHAVHAIGMIGDTSAAPAVLKAAATPDSNNFGWYLSALGQLPTTDSIDFLIRHLNNSSAVRALFDSGSPKALPALQEHLKKLESSRKEKDDGHNLAVTKIAVLRLSSQDPREKLMSWAEDRKQGAWLRQLSLDALDKYDYSTLTHRILKVYANGTDAVVRFRCVGLLEDQEFEGITLAMIEDALGRDAGAGMESGQYDLLEPLNRRLGTKYPSFEDLQTFLKARRRAGGR